MPPVVVRAGARRPLLIMMGRAGEDPLAVLRERHARGEIGHDESGRYPGRLIRTEPGRQPGHDGRG